MSNVCKPRRIANGWWFLCVLVMLSGIARADAGATVFQNRGGASGGYFLGAMALMLCLVLIHWGLTRVAGLRHWAAYLGAVLLAVWGLDIQHQALLGVAPDFKHPIVGLAVPLLLWTFGWRFAYCLLSRQGLPQESSLGLHGAVAAGWVWALLALVLGVAAEGARGLWLACLVALWVAVAVGGWQVYQRRTPQAAVVVAVLGVPAVLGSWALVELVEGMAPTRYALDALKWGLLLQVVLTYLYWLLQISEQQAVERDTLAASFEEQAERVQRKELIQVLGMFGHEVRTPLAVIDSTTQSLQMLPGANQPELAERYKRIRAAVERLTLLAREALSRERLEAAGWQPVFRPVDLRELLVQLLDFHGVDVPNSVDGMPLRLPLNVGGQANGSLELRWPDPWPPCVTDPDMLHVVLSNLLDNACKYSERGGLVKLQVAVDTGVGSIRFEVLSRGLALAPDDLDRVFEKYWRRHERRNAAGAGLGLHLVRQIAVSLGGRAQARNLSDRWTGFSIEIPLRPSAV
jgi:signal transduction histidine kinase